MDILASWDGIMTVQKQLYVKYPPHPLLKSQQKLPVGGGGGVNARDCYAFGVFFKSHKR